MQSSFTGGFTMIEMLIVCALAAMVGGLALVVSMETLRGSDFRSDRDLFVAALQRARAESMNNVCLGNSCTDGEAHGVRILPNGTFVIFQGTSYATRDAAVDAVYTFDAATTSGAMQIIFTQLAGTTTPAFVLLADRIGHVSTTTIGSDGQISWTQ